ncbi:Aminomethyltransferase, mitochondrial [Yamadazyma tenuis]|uniref:Aminomethyltransferase n=1 Tax=Candida tenuis (strain ATCC 10573 / BCRC 21748 / CBS 615 / JCM 9827 / NBRC 10315 / NRRL Y-1498 / VKM Y-70) TaxID=590646 RepID=G3BA11_CANTC|nr:uncharacterized protein CANTEDRAFT_131436 [Yamadazyma tenuis ATCC 10573]XP_006688154.1 glycine cleavage system T protein [Yamadazyma tenuis ATCC 10573]EGV61983.1 hypothetical protein CANTEDRAFT_131436 [Yamadazyma tenuis ATCC 10573]EGV61984.1 glycine cleavage system T protein [Yamadazyma tenuis ATCC 10573]WEJ93236.1 Aminomethyltransferase, mitochondrial [Yamadazyma tenuis]
MLRTVRHNSTSFLIRTPLYKSHVKYGAKFVPYAGFEMPILYKGLSHIDSHKWVRSKVGLFDVSHMLQHTFTGRYAVSVLQKMTPIDLSGLSPNTSSLSVLLNETGGIIDDCIITKVTEGEYYMVTNAGCREKDLAFINSTLADYDDVNHSIFESTLLAIQGPKAAEILSKYSSYDLSKLKFGAMVRTGINSLISSQIQISRTGYTGEDGFELSIPSSSKDEIQESNEFFQSLVDEQPDVVQPIGLAARDSLRLEAGMCLYGNDLTEEITPVEASLTWLIPKTRRNVTDSQKFNGYDRIIQQINDKKSVPRRRIGITTTGPAPRSGSKIFDTQSGEEVGVVTSGLLSPILGHNVGQAYIDKKVKIGASVDVEVRGKKRPGIVAKLPFIQNNFYK